MDTSPILHSVPHIEQSSSTVSSSNASSQASSVSTPIVTIKDEDEDDNIPLDKLAARIKRNNVPIKDPVDEDDEDSMPLSLLLAKKSLNQSKRNISLVKPHPVAHAKESKKPRIAETKKAAVIHSDADDDVPLSQLLRQKKDLNVAKSQNLPATAPKIVTIADVPQSQLVTATDALKKKSRKSPPNSSTSLNEDVEGEHGEGEHRWWEDPSILMSDVKWSSLEHNGLLFPPDYVPHGVPIVYEGREIVLPPEAEEIAGFYAHMLDTEYAKNDVFNRNFFEDFTELLRQKYPDLGALIRRFEACDFTRMHHYFLQQKEAKKQLSKEEKECLKEEKRKIDEHYGYCLLDGRREKVGNFRVEPPGLFRGRGKHPKTGRLKCRVQPEQITLNIGEGAPIPPPPAGHSWGKIVHNNEVAWLACWIENVNNSYKYVLFAANSTLKGQSDLKKFEKARELKFHIERIRETMSAELRRSEDAAVCQRATALWLIDRLALRAGNEKGEDEADTVGCCSLRCEHVTCEPPHFIVFDFLGKDSIRYYNRVPVAHEVFKNIKLFKRQKRPQDPLFDRLNVNMLNAYLDKLMPGLTAKVFRTFNASHTFQQQLRSTPATAESVHEKILSYNRSNREVAILCNHQRAVPKTHQTSMARLEEKIGMAKLQRYRIKNAIRLLMKPAALQQAHPDVAAGESDLEDDAAKIEELVKVEMALEAQKAEKARTKKLAQQGDTAAVTASSQTSIDESLGNAANLSLSSRSSSNQDLSQQPLEKLEKALARSSASIAALKMQRTDRDENKATALGTSKLNYLDPRISAAWCKKHGVPIERIFAKTLREKFKWAMSVAADWEF